MVKIRSCLSVLFGSALFFCFFPFNPLVSIYGGSVFGGVLHIVFVNNVGTFPLVAAEVR